MGNMDHPNIQYLLSDLNATNSLHHKEDNVALIFLFFYFIY